VTVARSAYEAGQSSLLDVLEAQRSLLAIERLVANLRATREKRLADLEAATGTALTAQNSAVRPPETKD
jgi:outer membrane protein TolC